MRRSAAIGAAAAVALLVGFALAGAGPAGAHGARHVEVKPILDPMPAALAGMRVALYDTLGPQLVLENPTERRVEVLDAAGRPFLRIDRAGVEGDLASPDWYRTQGPAAVVPASLGDTAPRWVRASADSSFGWFDPRLDGTEVQVPHAVVDAGRTADLGRWRVPLRVDGVRVDLTGRFRYAPPAKGAYVARLTSPSELAPGVRVTLLPGRVPGLLVHNTSEQPLVVFGARGEPFLRIAPDGVDANLESPTWLASARSASAERPAASASSGEAPRWQRVAPAGRFSWVEPRAAAPDGAEGADFAWQVPMTFGDEALRITGIAAWTSAERKVTPH